MIITNDSNFPRIIFIINNFKDIEVKTLSKEVIRLHRKSLKEKVFINFHVDLFYLDDYNNSYIKQAVDELAGYSYSYVNSITLYLNSNNNNFLLKSIIYIYKIRYNLPIKYVETDTHIVLK